MQSSTRNHYDIVTEGIISTIPEKFRLQSYVKHYPQTNFPKLPSNFNIWHGKEKEGGGGEKDYLLNNNRLPGKIMSRKRSPQNYKEVACHPYVRIYPNTRPDFQIFTTINFLPLRV